MAHLNGGFYCGCPRATRMPEPVASDSEAPVIKLIDFMHEHLSEKERDRLIGLIASRKGMSVPRPRTHAWTR